jgi:hypothetical protein
MAGVIIWDGTFHVPHSEPIRSHRHPETAVSGLASPHRSNEPDAHFGRCARVDDLLLPDCEDDQDLVRHVRNYCGEIFEDQLDGWYQERFDWPVDRDFATFCLWFEYRAHTLLLDLCDSPLRHI